MEKERIVQAAKAAGKPLLNALPTLLAILLFISIAKVMVPSSWYQQLFGYNNVLDVFIDNLLGSILAGNAANSYIIGGELLKQGVNLYAITAFLVAWVTVGFIQFPAEAILLGKRFAIVRNLVSFFLSLIVALLTVFLVTFI